MKISYDCSVTDRKGCNYCNRRKQIPNIKDTDDIELVIIGELNQIQLYDSMKLLQVVKINYCPICGKKLKEQTNA